MTNDTRTLLRALDEVTPPAQWDDIVAAASEPGALRLPVRTGSKGRRPAVLVAAVLLVAAAGATAIGLAVRSDGPVEVRSTPASEPAAPDGPAEPGQEGPPASLRWEDATRVLIYLDPDATDEQTDALSASIDADPAVEAFVHLDKVAAYEDFLEKFKDAPELTAEVDPAILPTSFELLPVDPSAESVERIKATYEGEPGVLQVMIPGR